MFLFPFYPREFLLRADHSLGQLNKLPALAAPPAQQPHEHGGFLGAEEVEDLTSFTACLPAPPLGLLLQLRTIRFFPLLSLLTSALSPPRWCWGQS